MNFQFLQKNVVNANAKPSKQLKEKPPNVIVDMKMLNTKVVILRDGSSAIDFQTESGLALNKKLKFPIHFQFYYII